MLLCQEPAHGVPYEDGRPIELGRGVLYVVEIVV
jgi:hypothetical protein